MGRSADFVLDNTLRTMYSRQDVVLGHVDLTGDGVEETTLCLLRPIQVCVIEVVVVGQFMSALRCQEYAELV